jgi:hypothetical protein
MPKHSLDRPYPADWSVPEALAAYLNENGFTTEQYDADVVNITFFRFTFPLLNPPQRKIAVRFHDLHHLVTGYGTDPMGEAEISAWELRRGMNVFGIYVQTIIFAGTCFGLCHSPRRTVAAWRAAKSNIPLQSASLPVYQELLRLSVGELRSVYGIPHAGIAAARTLHEKAPDTSPNSSNE